VNKNRNQILEAGSKGEEVSIEGIVVPYELDARFKATSLLLSTNMELDLVIEHNAGETPLFEHLREPVRVKGFIREGKPGQWLIRVTDYKPLI
jgi:hypothetical protein